MSGPVRRAIAIMTKLADLCLRGERYPSMVLSVLGQYEYAAITGARITSACSASATSASSTAS
jgi:hypothetical protein